ncbi:MAG: hypothetical protein SVY53_02435 [Chloroflexota bacterium]|nr:hypothetical protein [Chloroflexota bacterium]
MAKIAVVHGACDVCGESFDVEANLTGLEEDYIDSMVMRGIAKRLTDWFLRRSSMVIRVTCQCGSVMDVPVHFQEGHTRQLGKLAYSTKEGEKVWRLERR